MSDLRNKPRMAVSRESTFHPPMVRNRAPSSGLPNDVLTKYEPRIKSCFEEERKQIDEETTLRTSGIRMGKKRTDGEKETRKTNIRGCRGLRLRNGRWK